MMLCPVCGKSCEDDSKFCPFCGVDLQHSAPVPPAPEEKQEAPEEAHEADAKEAEFSEAPVKEREVALFDTPDSDDKPITAFSPKKDAADALSNVFDGFDVPEPAKAEDEEPVFGEISKAVLGILGSIPMMFAALMSTLSSLMFIIFAVNELIQPSGVLQSVADTVIAVFSAYGLRFTYALNGDILSIILLSVLILPLLASAGLWVAYFSARYEKLRLGMLKLCLTACLMLCACIYLALIVLSVFMILLEKSAMTGVAIMFLSATLIFLLSGLLLVKVIRMLSNAEKTVYGNKLHGSPSVYAAVMLAVLGILSAVCAAMCSEALTVLAFLRAAAGFAFISGLIFISRARLVKKSEY